MKGAKVVKKNAKIPINAFTRFILILFEQRKAMKWGEVEWSERGILLCVCVRKFLAH